jgi:hypothetical protein
LALAGLGTNTGSAIALNSKIERVKLFRDIILSSPD